MPNWCYVAFFAATQCLGQPTHAISVFISDNLAILDERNRSASIMLLNSGVAPVEFEIKPKDARDGEQDGQEMLRWSPQRIMVPPGEGSPLRFAFRPNADTESGEYVVRFGVSSRRLSVDPPFRSTGSATDPSEERGVGASVSIQPVIEVVVYLHIGELEPVDVQVAYEPPKDGQSSAFEILKLDSSRSFIGYVQTIESATNRRLRQGRVHMAQATDRYRFKVPRDDDDSGAICLRMWRTAEPKASPNQTFCSE